ncbi:MAG: hypothetical protein ABIG11_04685, partial [bacterium]
MIIKNLNKFKVSTTTQAITSFAGLPLMLSMARSLGLEERINALPLKERARGYKPAESAFALMGLIQSGGEALDDVSLLNGDEGLSELWGNIPAANTLGEWLRRFNGKTVYLIGKIQLETAVKVIRSCGLKQLTVDVDSFFLEHVQTAGAR